ncbi:MAG: hypothetical protein ACTHM1_04270 [Solirubrobacteraceae bacterium]
MAFRDRLTTMPAIGGFTAAIAAALVLSIAWMAPPSMASDYYWTTLEVDQISGPNELPIDRNWAHNLSGKGICNKLWEYQGGGAYRELAKLCESSATEFEIIGGCYQNGHGQVIKYYQFTYKLAGEQWYDGCV